MKKLVTVTIPLLLSLINPVATFAQSPGPLDITPGQPGLGISANASPGGVITNALTIAYTIAAIIVLFFMIWGAFQWITSSGDKDRVANARKTIIHTLVGLAILALSFLIIRVVGDILNINILNLGSLPRLGPAASP